MKANKHQFWKDLVLSLGSGFCLITLLFFYSPLQAQHIAQMRDSVDAGFDRGEYERIMPLLYQLRSHYKAAKDSIGYAETFSYIVSCQYHSGNIEIKPYADSAFQVGKQYQIDPLSDFYGTIWSLQGNYYKNRAAYAEALLAFEELLRIDTTLLALDPKHPRWYVGSAYQNIGTIYSNMGDNEQAIAYYQYALPYLEEVSQELVNTYINIGYSYKQLEDSEQSTHYYQQANTLIQESKQAFRPSLLLDVETNLYETDKLQLKRLFVRIPSTDLIRLARNYQLRANIHQNEKAFESAQLLSQKALQLRRQKYGAKHPSIAISYKRLGNIADSLKQPKLALQHYQKALAALVWDFNDSLDIRSNPNLQQQISSKVELLDVLRSKAKSLVAANHPAIALSTFELLLDLIDDLRINYVADHSIYQLLAHASPSYEAAIELALQLEYPQKAFEFIARSKAALLVEGLHDLYAKQQTALPDSLLQSERDLKIDIAYYERQRFHAQRRGQIEKAKQWEQLHFEKQQNYQQLLHQLEQDYPKYYQLKYRKATAGVADLQNNLANESALIEFFVGEQRSYAAVLTQQFFTIHRLTTSDKLDEQVTALRTTLAKPSTQAKDFQLFGQYAYTLYRSYFRDLVAGLPANIQKIVLIPDKQLGYVPFQALVQFPLTGRYEEARYDTLSYLIQDYQFVYAYASTLLLEPAHSTCTSTIDNYGGFAPSFDIPHTKIKEEQLNTLLAAQEEVTQIDSIINGVIYIGAAATKNAFLEHSDNYKILHLATHANMDDYNPMHSKIHFIDDYLTTREIYNLPICAELAVLSACETGIGKLKKGEGIMSLARAFTQAGCPSLVSSLWKVNDRQTSHIMIDFYKHLYAGKSKDKALYLAQTTYFDNITSYAQAHPYYWASFIMIGDTEAVFSVHTPYWWGVVALLVLLLVLYFFKKRKSN